MSKQQCLPISQFKAKCHAVIERVRRTGQPVLITRFGKPVAQVIPPPAPAPDTPWLGALRGQAAIVGDLTAQIREEVEWEALQQ